MGGKWTGQTGRTGGSLQPFFCQSVRYVKSPQRRGTRLSDAATHGPIVQVYLALRNIHRHTSQDVVDSEEKSEVDADGAISETELISSYVIPSMQILTVSARVRVKATFWTLCLAASYSLSALNITLQVISMTTSLLA